MSTSVLVRGTAPSGRLAGRHDIAHAATVRLLLVIAVTAVLACQSAAAATSPGSLVLRRADVPAGFVLDTSDSGLRTNAAEAASDPRLRALYARAGRITGYESEFDRARESISSRIDILRTPRGARVLLDWFAGEMRTAGVKGLERRRARLGDEAWVYRGGTDTGFTIVAWRSGRVFSGVAVVGLPTARALGYARLQQRRIAAAYG